MDDLDKIREDIRRAREWIENRFNAYRNEDETPSGMFMGRPTFMVEYPDVDSVFVRPVFYGKPMERVTGAEYRLVWRRNGIYWRGGPLLRPDIVVNLKVPSKLYVDTFIRR